VPQRQRKSKRLAGIGSVSEIHRGWRTENEKRISDCPGKRLHVAFKIGAERFSGDPSFTRSRRSMSLAEVRRFDLISSAQMQNRPSNDSAIELMGYQDL
jgi:hypothetical protein